MQLISTSFHHIDHDHGRIEKIETASKNNQLDKYVEGLLRIVTETKSRKGFTFRSNTTQVRVALDLMLSGKFEEGAEINANRLLTVEKSAQDSYAQITNIQKGVLFQASLSHENKQIIVVSKADHSDFLEESKLVLQRGLPLKRQLFKAMAVSFDVAGSIDTVFVMDSNRRISKYWWETYLELKEKHTNEHNTKNALDYLDRRIFNPIKKKFPADYIILRNSTVCYFRNQDTFDINHYTQSLISQYEPVNQNLKPNELESKILALPEKGDFDSSFPVEKAAIKRKVIHKIPLTESIELILKGGVSELSSVIRAYIDDEGKKYITIRTDEGYEQFKR